MIIVYGASGYIGRNLCSILDYENKPYTRITRYNITNIQKIIDVTNTLDVIYCIHDFTYQQNNIHILKSVLQTLCNYNIHSFVYISSWVVLFDKYNQSCKYTKTKLKIEQFLYTQKYVMQNVVKIVRPPLVIGKQGQFDKYIHILRHFEVRDL